MKRKKSILVLTIALIICTSCKKEFFPDVNDILGNWIEKTTSSEKAQLTFENDGTAYLTKPNQLTDTFNYSLSGSEELLYLSNAAGESNHKIELNKKTDELTIWNLYPGIPEDPSVTTFEKK